MFRAIIDFLSRLRLPGPRQIVPLFFRPRAQVSALSGFQSTIADLNHVADHHARQAGTKATIASVLQRESAEHTAEAQAATAVAGKIKALITV